MKTGILIINTGTPDAPTKEAIAPYLTEFLMDPAIISAPIFVRKPLVKRIVSKRPERTVEHYRALWTPEGSPFMLTSIAQRDLLEQTLREHPALPDNTKVVLAMRYGNPSIRSGLEKLRGAGCDTIVLVPLYPQNVNVCAGTCLKCARKHLAALAKNGWKPEVREVKSFHDQPAYRNALAESVKDAWSYQPGSKLFVSFHSTMMADIKKDPTYLRQCTETKDWLAADLGIPEEDVILSFQSRFDNRKWLGPFTEPTLRELADKGVKDVCIVCPGFVADNLETTIEVDHDLRETFESAASLGSEAAQPASDGEAAQPASDDKAARFTSSDGTKQPISSDGAAQPINDGQAAQPASDGGAARFTYVPALGQNPGLIEAIATAIVQAL